LDTLLANLDQVKKASHRQALETHREQALLSRELARIKCDLVVDVDFEKLQLRPPDRARLHDLFSRLEFHTLLPEFLPEPVEVQREYKTIRDARELQQALSAAVRVAIHLESADGGFGPPIAAAFSARKHSASIVPLIPVLGGSEELTAVVRELLESGRELVAHDMKAQLRRLLHAGWSFPKRFTDTMIVSYVLNPGAYGHELETLAHEKLKRKIITLKELSKAFPQFSLEVSACCDYLGEKPDFTIELAEILEPQLEKDPALRDIYERIELPLIPVLARMEHRGIKIDAALLATMSKAMGEQLEELEKKIYKEAGEEFNINSPLQLSTILFDKLQYPVLKKTQKTKTSSTGVEVLRELAGYGYAVPQLILEHRELHKLKSTYVDALPQLVAPDGRVHTSFNQAVAATGRLSSSDPNLQNIPVRTQTGREIRRAFIAEEGNVLLAADYSQIELRILAHMTEDSDLIDAFKRGVDIHRATAAKVFNVAEPFVTPDQRRASKTINFGVLYGMSAFRLGNELGIPTGEAKEFIDAYFNRYPRIREYLERTLTEARNTGKVTTLFGRVRYIPEIHNRSFTVRSNAERMATNAPIQGTAADLLKLAMIALDARLDSEISEAAMLLTVHDEIVIEVPERWVDETEKLVRTTMETIYPLAVPLAVDTHWGRSWYEAKG
ncbi:MAG TPA: DNA polymerase I, partial [Thermoanaerobaculia bacterium]